MDIREFYISQGWRVTSPYGERTHPITGEKHFHYGIDFGGKSRGAPVPTPYGGEVVGSLFLTYGRGNTVVIRIAEGILQIIQHLDTLGVKKGQHVHAWDIIGTNGSTGASTGPHIHYELRKDIPTKSGSPVGRYVWGNPDNYKVPILPKDERVKYTVASGDTLASIASRFNVTVELLIEWNNITNPDRIYVGQELWISPPVEPEPAPDPTPQLGWVHKIIEWIKRIFRLWFYNDEE